MGEEDIRRPVRADSGAGGILAEARATGVLSDRLFERATALVSRTPKARRSAVARGIVQDARDRTRFIEKEENASLEDAATYASGGKRQTFVQILEREDEALLRRAARLGKVSAGLGVAFLQSFKDPSYRERAVAILEETARSLRATAEVAKDPARVAEWERKWSDLLREVR